MEEIMLKRWLLTAMVMSVVGCAGAEDMSQGEQDLSDEQIGERLAAIDLDPATLEEGGDAMEQIDDLLTQTNGDETVLAAAHELSDKLDALSGLFSKVQVGNRKVGFFQAADGTVTISDRGPLNSDSVLDAPAYRDLRAADLFRAIAPHLEVPEQLLRSEQTRDGSAAGIEALDQARSDAPDVHSSALEAQRQDSEIASTRQALTGSDADARWFRANRCPTTGFGPYCYPQTGGDGSWASWGDYRFSTFNVAPFAGGVITVRQTTDGTVRGNFAVFVGEDARFTSQGPTRSVLDPNFHCPWYAFGLCATPMIPTVVAVWHSWEIVNASGDSFHFGGNWSN
jgi:hypothetical protein